MQDYITEFNSAFVYLQLKQQSVSNWIIHDVQIIPWVRHLEMPILFGRSVDPLFLILTELGRGSYLQTPIHSQSPRLYAQIEFHSHHMYVQTPVSVIPRR